MLCIIDAKMEPVQYDEMLVSTLDADDQCWSFSSAKYPPMHFQLFMG